MKIVCLSDTHRKEKNIVPPDGDILVHCGDYSFQGSEKETAEFAAWLAGLPHRQIVMTWGNHERGPERDPALHRAILQNVGPRLTLLEHSAATVEGIRFFGSPYTPRFCNWAFNVDRGPALAALWSQIPDDTEVLLTHGPPAGILDQVEAGWGRFDNVGCEDLARRITQLPRLRASIFGHLHLQGGRTETHNGVQFVNAAVCTEDYHPENPIVCIDL